MFGKKKRKAQSAPQTETVQVPTNPQVSQSSSGFELQVFDGKGHPATMVFTTDSSGRVRQHLKKNRDFRAHLPHTHR